MQRKTDKGLDCVGKGDCPAHRPPKQYDVNQINKCYVTLIRVSIASTRIQVKWAYIMRKFRNMDYRKAQGKRASG